MTRLWPGGQPIDVAAPEQGRPGRFTWQGQEHQVVRVVKSWRVDIDWWRVRVWRAYYKLYTDTGLLVVLFQDLLSQEWFLQRLYD